MTESEPTSSKESGQFKPKHPWPGDEAPPPPPPWAESSQAQFQEMMEFARYIFTSLRGSVPGALENFTKTEREILKWQKSLCYMGIDFADRALAELGRIEAAAEAAAAVAAASEAAPKPEREKIPVL